MSHNFSNDTNTTTSIFLYLLHQYRANIHQAYFISTFYTSTSCLLCTVHIILLFLFVSIHIFIILHFLKFLIMCRIILWGENRGLQSMLKKCAIKNPSKQKQQEYKILPNFQKQQLRYLPASYHCTQQRHRQQPLSKFYTKHFQGSSQP